MPELKVKSPAVVEPEKVSPKEKLEKITTHVMTFKGKKGYNPYLYIKNVIDPLMARLATGDAKVAEEIGKLPDNPEPTIEGYQLKVTKIDTSGAM